MEEKLAAKKELLVSAKSVRTRNKRYLFLKKRLSAWQIAGIALVILGLCCKSWKSFQEIFHKEDASKEFEPDYESQEKGGDIFAILFLLLGTIFHSLTNVVNQKLLTKDEDRIPPATLSAIIGAISVGGYLMYILGMHSPPYAVHYRHDRKKLHRVASRSMYEQRIWYLEPCICICTRSDRVLHREAERARARPPTQRSIP